MTEEIKEIVDQYFEDREHSSWGTYKYKLNSSYWVKFQPTNRIDHIRVYLGIELPGYQYVTSGVYEIYNGPLNDADKGLAALILMKYREVEKMNMDGISIGYNCYKSVLEDNDKLRAQIKDLEKEVDTWKKASIENHNAYLSAMSGYADYQNKYIQEKMDHTTTKCRAVFAKKILSGACDDRVMDHLDISLND